MKLNTSSTLDLIKLQLSDRNKIVCTFYVDRSFICNFIDKHLYVIRDRKTKEQLRALTEGEIVRGYAAN